MEKKKEGFPIKALTVLLYDRETLNLMGKESFQRARKDSMRG